MIHLFFAFLLTIALGMMYILLTAMQAKMFPVPPGFVFMIALGILTSIVLRGWYCELRPARRGHRGDRPAQGAWGAPEGAPQGSGEEDHRDDQQGHRLTMTKVALTPPRVSRVVPPSPAARARDAGVASRQAR